MLVRDAKVIACEWVEAECTSLPDFDGAYLAGSMSSMPDDAMLPDASDVDIKVVRNAGNVAPDPQKFVYRGVVFDISYGLSSDVASPEDGSSKYATSLRAGTDFRHARVAMRPGFPGPLPE